MKHLLLAASLLTVMAGAALAGEGNGDPFPFAAAGAVVADVPTSPAQMTGQTPQMAKMPPNSVAYGRREMAATLHQYVTAPVTQGTLLPSDGSQAALQSANSAPHGFQEGTAADARTDALQRYSAARSLGNARQGHAQLLDRGRAAAGG
jgi:hypothetical protein